MQAEEILSRVDHTLLKQTATWADIEKICEEAVAYKTATVMVPSCFITKIRENYGGKVKIATVVGFPNGNCNTAAKIAPMLGLMGTLIPLGPGIAALGQAVLGNRVMAALCRALHRCSCGLIPLWTPAMPHRVRGFSPRRAAHPAPAGKVVYFPSCINQRMGPAKGDPSQKPLVNEMTELLEKAGFEVVFPEGMKNLCCGMTWESKGMPDVADSKTAELADALRRASENGRWPIVCDQSPCLYRMKRKIEGLELFEPFGFIERFVLPRLEITPVDTCVALHPTCTMRKMGLVPTILNVARACARDVVLPEEIGCCAFAGDKGFTDPGFNAWALRKLRARIAAAGATEGYSNSRTCEIGLTLHSGIPYMGIATLVNRVSKAKKDKG